MRIATITVIMQINDDESTRYDESDENDTLTIDNPFSTLGCRGGRRPYDNNRWEPNF